MLAEMQEQGRPRKRTDNSGPMQVDISTPDAVSQAGASQQEAEDEGPAKVMNNLAGLLEKLTERMNNLEEATSSADSWTHASRE